MRLLRVRDVIAFPKNQKGQEMMTQSPGIVSESQLSDLNISVVETTLEEAVVNVQFYDDEFYGL